MHPAHSHAPFEQQQRTQQQQQQQQEWMTVASVRSSVTGKGQAAVTRAGDGAHRGPGSRGGGGGARGYPDVLSDRFSGAMASERDTKGGRGAVAAAGKRPRAEECHDDEMLLLR